MPTTPPPPAPRWSGFVRLDRRGPWVAVPLTAAPTWGAAWLKLLAAVRGSADLLVTNRNPNKVIHGHQGD